MAMKIDDYDDAPQDGAVDLLYSFMHPSLLSLVSKYKERYGLNGLQATTAAAPSCSIPPTKKDRSSTPR